MRGQAKRGAHGEAKSEGGEGGTQAEGRAETAAAPVFPNGLRGAASAPPRASGVTTGALPEEPPEKVVEINGRGGEDNVREQRRLLPASLPGQKG